LGGDGGLTTGGSGKQPRQGADGVRASVKAPLAAALDRIGYGRSPELPQDEPTRLDRRRC
jgi:hypothetical protein